MVRYEQHATLMRATHEKDGASRRMLQYAAQEMDATPRERAGRTVPMPIAGRSSPHVIPRGLRATRGAGDVANRVANLSDPFVMGVGWSVATMLSRL